MRGAPGNFSVTRLLLLRDAPLLRVRSTSIGPARPSLKRNVVFEVANLVGSWKCEVWRDLHCAVLPLGGRLEGSLKLQILNFLLHHVHMDWYSRAPVEAVPLEEHRRDSRWRPPRVNGELQLGIPNRLPDAT